MAGRQYEGYLFAQAAKPVDIVVELQDFTQNNRTIGATTISFAGGNWTMLNFSITVDDQGTQCNVITPGSDPNIQCGNMGTRSLEKEREKKKEGTTL